MFYEIALHAIALAFISSENDGKIYVNEIETVTGKTEAGEWKARDKMKEQ